MARSGKIIKQGKKAPDLRGKTFQGFNQFGQSQEIGYTLTPEMPSLPTPVSKPPQSAQEQVDSVGLAPQELLPASERSMDPSTGYSRMDNNFNDGSRASRRTVSPQLEPTKNTDAKMGTAPTPGREQL